LRCVTVLPVYTLLAFFCFFLCTGCDYNWDRGLKDSQGNQITVAVPYVVGDPDGFLTNEIIQMLSHSESCRVRQWNAKYRLEVSVKQIKKETVGYRRDKQNIQGGAQKNLIGSEERKGTVVEAALYDNSSNQIVRGPFQVEADVDFDYIDEDSIEDLFVSPSNQPRQPMLVFSLGQLESIETAQEAATQPLNASLAKKIIDVIFVEKCSSSRID